MPALLPGDSTQITGEAVTAQHVFIKGHHYRSRIEYDLHFDKKGRWQRDRGYMSIRPINPREAPQYVLLGNPTFKWKGGFVSDDPSHQIYHFKKESLSTGKIERSGCLSIKRGLFGVRVRFRFKTQILTPHPQDNRWGWTKVSPWPFVVGAGTLALGTFAFSMRS